MKTIKLFGVTLLVSVTVRRLSDGKLFMPIISNPDLGYYKSLLALDCTNPNHTNSFIDWETVKLNPSRFEILNSFRVDEVEDFLSKAVVEDGNPLLIIQKFNKWVEVNR